MEQLSAIFYKLTMRLFHAFGTSVEPQAVRSVLITSARSGEGKSFIAQQLSAYLAGMSNEKILLVDANFEQANARQDKGAANGNGFSDCLTSGEYANLDFRATKYPNLSVLSVGRNCKPGLLFKPQPVQEFLERMAGKFSVVLIDGGTASTSGCLPHVAGGIILVVDTLKTRREVVQGAMANMDVDAGKYYGVILNKKVHYIPTSFYKFL